MNHGDYRIPLEIAVEIGNEDLLELLLAAGSTVDSKNLLHLAFLDHRTFTRALHVPGGNPCSSRCCAQAPSSIRACIAIPSSKRSTWDGRMQPAFCSRAGRECKGNNEEGNFSGRGAVRPLELAIEKNDLYMLQLLLASGAKVNVPDTEDPLHTAARHSGLRQCCSFCSQLELKINRRSPNSETALHEAIRCQNVMAEQFLRQHQHGGVK